MKALQQEEGLNKTPYGPAYLGVDYMVTSGPPPLRSIFFLECKTFHNIRFLLPNKISVRFLRRSTIIIQLFQRDLQWITYPISFPVLYIVSGKFYAVSGRLCIVPGELYTVFFIRHPVSGVHSDFLSGKKLWISNCTDSECSLAAQTDGHCVDRVRSPCTYSSHHTLHLTSNAIKFKHMQCTYSISWWIFYLTHNLIPTPVKQVHSFRNWYAIQIAISTVGINFFRHGHLTSYSLR